MVVLNLIRMPQIEAAELLRLLRTLADEVARPPQNAPKRPDKPVKNPKRKNPALPELLLPADTGPGADGYLRTTNHSKNGHAHPETERER